MGLREDQPGGLHIVMQKLLFFTFVENSQVNGMIGLLVSPCGQGMDKGVALTQLVPG